MKFSLAEDNLLSGLVGDVCGQDGVKYERLNK